VDVVITTVPLLDTVGSKCSSWHCMCQYQW